LAELIRKPTRRNAFGESRTDIKLDDWRGPPAPVRW